MAECHEICYCRSCAKNKDNHGWNHMQDEMKAKDRYCPIPEKCKNLCGGKKPIKVCASFLPNEKGKTPLECYIADWKKEANLKSYEETVACHIDGKTLYIVTRFPGRFIGKAKTLYDKYAKVLKEKFGIKDIRFIDIFCGDVKIF